MSREPSVDRLQQIDEIFHEALQRDPDVVMAHSQTMKVLAGLG